MRNEVVAMSATGHEQKSADQDVRFPEERTSSAR